MKQYAILVTAFASHCALGANVVTQWNGAISNSRYLITGNTIQILSNDPSGGVFKLNAYESTDPSVAGDIDSITVGAGVTGVLRIAILPDPNSIRTYGGVDVKKIDFSTLVNPEIVGLKINGDLGSVTSGDKIILGASGVRGTISSVFEVGGDLKNVFIFDDASTAISFTGNQTADVTCDSPGDITFNGAGPHAGTFLIAEQYGGTLTIGGTHNGEINIRRGGAVYFSQTGPTTIGDIVVAEIDAAVTVASTGQALQTITGEFYVKH